MNISKISLAFARNQVNPWGIKGPRKREGSFISEPSYGLDSIVSIVSIRSIYSSNIKVNEEEDDIKVNEEEDNIKVNEEEDDIKVNEEEDDFMIIEEEGHRKTSHKISAEESRQQ